MELLKPYILRIYFIVLLLFVAINISTAQVITVNSTPSSVNTVYGEATSLTSTTFILSGNNLSAGILVIPPTAFEVSRNNTTYTNTLNIPLGPGGIISPTTIYIRLKAITPAGNYSGNVVLSSAGTTVNVAMPNSTVSRASINIRIYAEINYGDVLNDITLTSSNFDFSKVDADLKNGEKATALDVTLSGGNTGREPVGVYNSVIASSNLRGTNGFVASNYAINYISGPITIYPAPLVITANNITKPYGNTLVTMPGSTDFTVSSSLPNNEIVNSVTVTYGNGAASNSPVATYNGSVVPSAEIGGNGFVRTNYAITYLPASITVTPAPLTVTADNKSKLYGDPNPPLTIAYAGFVNGEGTAQLTTQPIASTTATQSSYVGDYPITVTGGSSPNYTLSYVDGTLTVYKDISIPNTFTPNGDNINDTWNIGNLDPNAKISVEIMSRYGARVYFSNGYSVPWDGYNNGVPVPFGVYYYVIKGVKQKPITGYVTVVR